MKNKVTINNSSIESAGIPKDYKESLLNIFGMDLMQMQV